MMLLPCHRCSRHVRVESNQGNARCPFCGGEAPSATTPSDARTRWRWLSISALTLVGLPMAASDCGNSVAMYGAPCVDDNCGAPHIAADASVDPPRDADASDDANAIDANDANANVDAPVDASSDGALDASDADGS